MEMLLPMTFQALKLKPQLDNKTHIKELQPQQTNNMYAHYQLYQESAYLDHNNDLIFITPFIYRININVLYYHLLDKKKIFFVF